MFMAKVFKSWTLFDLIITMLQNFCVSTYTHGLTQVIVSRECGKEQGVTDRIRRVSVNVILTKKKEIFRYDEDIYFNDCMNSEFKVG